MIKKVLAGVIIVYALFMGFVVIKGGLKEQANENSNTTPTQNTQKPSPSTASNTTSPSSSKTYTLSDVAKHSATTDCWIVINNNAYDVSSYIDQHPGGAREILRYCGKDATTGFDTRGGRGSHSSEAQAMLADFLIGTIK